ncbi:membrane protein YqhQ [Bacillus badius]|uniref:Membrane protein YqhQ n=2 Tax=Bacillus badius TaxID=1455 RepID=A0ABR5AZF5_BACBA|nr:membrane protein YqhQ [Bacillus badius]KIL79741.1 membrane protein YqhQ [Bacillus badius]
MYIEAFYIFTSVNNERGYKMSEQKPVYGGQALVEGVMFGGKHHTVTAIRRKDRSIEFFHLPRTPKPVLQKFKKIPFLRGIFAILDAAATGSKHLNFAQERYDVDPKEDEQLHAAAEPSKWSMILSVAAVGILSFLFGKFIFTLVPVLLAELTRPIFTGDFAQILMEGFFKLVLLLAYIYLISLTPLIKRVFQYHGAEHKVINAFESGLPLTVANVQSASRLHYRCGSSFILFTVIVGVFVYMLVPTDPLYVRILNRIALIPVVLGISFEVLQLTNKLRDIPVLRYLGYPGLWLQLLTTKEPEDDQVEVAIASFEKLLTMEESAKKGLSTEEIV